MERSEARPEHGGPGGEARTHMEAEIREQPAIVARLAADLSPYREACRDIERWGTRFVLFAARGTSDNAAVYGKYLATIRAGRPSGLAVPSGVTFYGAAIDFTGCAVIGISQSGRTPDVAEYLADARRRGAYTIAVTNDEGSVLAGAAHAVLPTGAGEERAVPATKTYTSQLAVLALLFALWSRDEETPALLRDPVPEAMETTLQETDAVDRLIEMLGDRSRLLVAARGYNFATSLEAALKLKETCYLDAAPYSAADLMHGPIAVVDPSWPALLFAAPGPTFGAMLELAGELRARGATVAVVGPPGEADHHADLLLPVAGDPPEPLSPLVAILPAQLLALRLALARGIDPDRPRGLSKVTETR